MKVLFYTHSPRAFRTTLIGYLFDVAKLHETILLSEKLDQETETALKRKDFFPRLLEIIPVEQFTGQNRGLLAKNKHLFSLAKEVISRYRPEVVILASDYHLFELYLARFAKRAGALVITTQVFFSPAEPAQASKKMDLANASLKFPSFLPLWFRLFLLRSRRSFGHFLYYWFLPLLNYQKPFWGKSSFILRCGWVGMRDSDCQTFFSKRDYQSYLSFYLKYSIPIEKLCILPHPLQLGAREIFEKIYFAKFKKENNPQKIVSIMLPGQKTIGFYKNNFLPIYRIEREKKWLEAVKSVNQVLEGWKIYIKPHPDTKDVSHLRDVFESISNDIKVTDPKDSADKYVEMADVIIELPLSLGASLFMAALQCPEKPIISLDLCQEFVGDGYKNFSGIEYIDNKDEFINVLNLIRDNKYFKRIFLNKINELKSEPIEFSNIIEAVEYLFQKRDKLGRQNIRHKPVLRRAGSLTKVKNNI